MSVTNHVITAQSLNLARVFHVSALASLILPLLLITTAHAQTYTLTTLASFNGTNGNDPFSGVTFDSAGDLYGTTGNGGVNNDGIVFKIAAGTNIITTLASFDSTNGNNPYGGITLDSAGNLYGTTGGGGANGKGSVFKIASGTNTATTLASFNGPNGSDPQAGITFDSAGNLYGTTLYGGANNGGTVFEIASGTNTITTLASFNGGYPNGGVTFDSAGNLYGTTQQGGAVGQGAVFEIASGTNTVTTLASFTGKGAGTNGANPYGGVTFDSTGNLYGTTEYGGDSFGTVFKIASGTNTVTTLTSFTGTNGAYPFSGVTLDSAGNLYGTTQQGGTNGYGTVFKIAVGTNVLTTLASFTGNGAGTNGATPFSGITLDSAGNLYGTTRFGGANGDGTVFKLSPSITATAPEPGALPLILAVATALAPITIWRVRRKRN